MSKRRGKNAGAGYGYMFSGAYSEKKDAVAKEKTRKGSFIKGTPTRHGYRYVVMTPRTNPIQRKKKEICGASVQGQPCTRHAGHRGPHLPQGATMRTRGRLPRDWQPAKNPSELLVMGANPTHEVTVKPGETLTIKIRG